LKTLSETLQITVTHLRSVAFYAPDHLVQDVALKLSEVAAEIARSVAGGRRQEPRHAANEVALGQ
jgi:hypothetical protein